MKPGLRAGTGSDTVNRLSECCFLIHRLGEGYVADPVEILEDQVREQANRLQHQAHRLADHEARFAQIIIDQSAIPTTGPSSRPLPPASAIENALLASSISSMPDIPSAGPLDLPSFGHTTSPGGVSITSFRDPQILPPDDIVRDLIALFFTHIHPWAPIISPTIPHYTTPWSVIVHAIVVVTLRLSNDPRLVTSKQHYKAAAKQHVLSHAIESTSIASVQALTLLALDLIGSEYGPKSWGILALLTRSAVHLGLTLEDESATPQMSVGRAPSSSLSRTSIVPPPMDWQEDEARRRLFWLIFSLDRYACVSTGWDFALPDLEVKRRLPCADSIWAGSVSAGGHLIGRRGNTLSSV